MSATYSEENLIENVRAHTSLYDMFSEDYRDQNVRKEAWVEIGDALKIPADKCKSEWTKLRNCFLNSIRRRRQKTSGQSAKHIPAWKFSKQMEFLLPFLENRE
ncbi:transcription factor Adf-1-like [Melanaphis sacchari]|uniref:transcription factor Adf-1-like n=1 Tax=Melanaphis sacchari TaxID=742174 RepID=UPI000DC144C6|nr:transcription factor Adf-1-like [Melanaphis sacchari]